MLIIVLITALLIHEINVLKFGYFTCFFRQCILSLSPSGITKSFASVRERLVIYILVMISE